MAEVKNCEWCVTEFEDKRTDGKRFCGKSCATKYRNSVIGNPMSSLRGDMNPNWRGGNLRKCNQCGSDFLDKHYDGRMFCSKSCAAKHNNQLRQRKPNDVKVKIQKSPKTPKPARSRKGPTIKVVKTHVPPKVQEPPKAKAISVVDGGRGTDRNKPLAKIKTTRPPISCEVCGKLFTSRRKSAKFCSRTCYRNAPDFAEKQGRRNSGKTLPEWHRQAVSKAQSLIDDDTRYTYGRNGHHDSLKAGNIFYRSSYEQLAYKLLDNDAAVTHYQPEPFVIKYMNQDGNVRRYRPDILISKEGQTILVEIKPQWKLSDPTTQLKIEAGKRYATEKGWVFEVWTEKELGI